MENDAYETESDQSEDNLYGGFHTSDNAHHQGDETEDADDSDDDIVRSFERSIAAILSTPHTLNSAAANTTSRNSNTYFRPSTPINNYISDQLQRNRPHATGEMYDFANDSNDDNLTMMDWRYNSSMEEVD